jgi:glycosyltransferase involved in cell wall biosynthesis
MTVPGRVTIGLPTLNRSGLAQRAIRSVLDQTYRDIELVVSDDVSTDDTVARVEETIDRTGNSRLVLFKQKERLGLVRNFDFCLRHATGEFFLLLGDDDLLQPQAIERLVRPFLHPPQGLTPDAIGVVWCPCNIANAESSQFWTTEAGPALEPPEEMIAGLWAGNRGPRLSSVLMRTADGIAVGGYQSRHGDLCDIGCYGAVALLHGKVVCVPEPLVQYTNHHGSTTSQSAIRQWQEWGRVVHADLLAGAWANRNSRAQRVLKGAKRNFVSSITLTILVQTVGKPGWIRNAVAEAFRSPGAVFTPYMARRLWKDGWKVLRLRRSGRQAPQTARLSAP